MAEKKTPEQIEEEAHAKRMAAIKTPLMGIPGLSLPEGWQENFLREYALSGVLRHACNMTGVMFGEHQRELLVNPEYKAAFEALEIDMDALLKDEVKRRMVTGDASDALLKYELMNMRGQVGLNKLENDPVNPIGSDKGPIVFRDARRK